jgi:hypothetical protein
VFIYDSFSSGAIPEQEKREIDKETGLDGPGIIKFIRDPLRYNKLQLEIAMAAKDEILIIFQQLVHFRQMKL